MEDMSAMQYEIIIRRAFNCGRFSKGADADLFRGLIADEFEVNENSNDKNVKSKYDRRMLQVKNYLIKALNKVISVLKNDSDIDDILDRISEIKSAANCNELKNVFRKTIDNLNEFNVGTD